MAARPLAVLACLLLLAIASAHAGPTAASPPALRGGSGSGGRRLVTPAADYDQTWAQRLVRQAAVSYCPWQGILAWDCAICGNVPAQEARVVNNTKYNLQAMVSYSASENLIFMAYRGTQSTSLKNWIVDLNVFQEKTQYPHCANTCYVHEGFYTAHLSINSQMVDLVKEFLAQHPDAQLSITGHSLGAALAVLAAAHMQTQEGIPVHSVYTYGTPRVGDSAFASWLSGVMPTMFHMVHYHDIVPHLPPEMFFFHHSSREVWYTEETGLDHKVCNGSGEDPSCSDSVDLWDFSVSDHYTYLDIIIIDCGKIDA